MPAGRRSIQNETAYGHSPLFSLIMDVPAFFTSLGIDYAPGQCRIINTNCSSKPARSVRQTTRKGDSMRKLIAVASALALLQTASVAQAQGVSFSINVGGPPIVVEQPPDFLYPAELGFGVAVGVPFDMFYLSGMYYVYRGGGWYRSSNYGGGWAKMRYRDLPPGLRRHKIERIHAFRDREHRMYVRDRDHYRGKYFRPGHDGRGPGHDERGPGHDGRGPGYDGRGPGHDGRGDVRGPEHDRRGDTREHRPNEHGGERRDQGHDQEERGHGR